MNDIDFIIEQIVTAYFENHPLIEILEALNIPKSNYIRLFNF